MQFFLDTNVLIYAAMAKSREPIKAPRAAALVEQGDFGISAQVLQEFFVNVTRKTPCSMPFAEAMEWISRLETQPYATIDAAIVNEAIALSRRCQIDYRDAAILAAAESLEAEIVYSEDLRHGQRYGSVWVLNPFRPS
ncbi:MAG TPA: PIN domain-containing protein [Rhizomicrobium sp.]